PADLVRVLDGRAAEREGEGEGDAGDGAGHRGDALDGEADLGGGGGGGHGNSSGVSGWRGACPGPHTVAQYEHSRSSRPESAAHHRPPGPGRRRTCASAVRPTFLCTAAPDRPGTVIAA